MRHNEAKAQRAVIEWWAWACRQFKTPEHLLLSVPNGGYRRPFEAKLLRQEGARPGAPDLLLLTPNAKYHGLAVEMKSEAGRLRKEQKEFLHDLALQGYAVVVCYGAEDAIREITGYLSNRPNA